LATTTTTQAASIIQKLVSQIVQQTLIQNSVLIPSITTYNVPNGADTLKIPRFTALASVPVVEGTCNTTALATVTTDDLVMNINEGIFWAISDKASIQTAIDMSVQLVRDGAKTLSASIDNAIVGELLKASASAPDHDIFYSGTADDIAIGDIVEARRLLNVANVPMTERYLLLSPDAEAQMLKIDNFIHAEKYGSNEPIQNGEIGKVYGFKVLISTSPNLVGNMSIAYHKTAVAYASQMDARFESDRNILCQQTEYALSQLFGVKVLDLGKRQVKMSGDPAVV